jgi:hypothetical protein
VEPRIGMHGAILHLPQYAFMEWCSVIEKHRGKLSIKFSITVLNVY